MHGTIISLLLIIIVVLPSQAVGEILLLPKTGQTSCYTNLGSAVDCSGTGQDGAFQAGVAAPAPRFTDNADGTVTDNLTGLVWLKNANCYGGKSWSNALTSAASLVSGSCGLSDGSRAGQWRLPNVNELESLLDIGRKNPALPGGHPFLSVQLNSYWSATGFSVNAAYRMNTVDGEVPRDTSVNIYTSYFVWPVRDAVLGRAGAVALPTTGQTTSYAAGDDGALSTGASWPAPRFADNADGTVDDNLTGLVWLKKANCFAAQSWSDALASAGTLAEGACGLTDGSFAGSWRLPNRKELLSLVDRSRRDPALPEGHPFLSVGTGSLAWSSSTNANSAAKAWVVNMGGGGGSSYSKTGAAGVWPVRGPQTWVVDSLTVAGFSGYGTGLLGTTTVKELTLRNNGSHSSSVTSMALSGLHASDYEVAPGGSRSCGSLTPTIAAGGSCTVMVSFIPKAGGPRSAELAIAAGNQATKVPLSGRGSFTVTGTVRTASGAGVAGVTFRGANCSSTDSSGAYVCTITTPEWSGMVVPKSASTLRPAWRSYIKIAGNQSSQDFEVLDPVFLNGFEGTDWNNVRAEGTSGAWTMVTAGSNPTVSPLAGQRMASFNSFISPAGDSAILFQSGTIYIPDSYPVNPALMFYMFHDTGVALSDYVQVLVSTDGVTWAPVGSPVYRNSGANGWVKTILDLNAYRGKSFLLGFLGVSAFGNNVYLDEVSIAGAPLYLISGRVKNAVGAGVPGVALTADAGATCSPTDSTGAYLCVITPDWSGGSLTPNLSGATFTPQKRVYYAMSADLEGQDFTITLPPPTISGTPAPSAQVGAGYSFTPTSSYATSFSIVNKPSWASFDASGATLSGTPTAAGTYAGIVISASNSSGTVSLPPFSITVSPTVPTGPTNLSATGGDGQASVTFSAPLSDGGSPVLSYTVTATPGNHSTSGSSSPITVTGLANDTAYTFTVSATNAAGTGPAASADLLFGLGVLVDGSGRGSVNSIPPGINCSGPDCRHGFGDAEVTLIATASSGSRFSGWGGACNGLGQCNLLLDSLYRSVTALFELLPNVRIQGNSRSYGLIQQAYEEAADGTAIEAKALIFSEQLTLGEAKAVTLRGGFDESFSTRGGSTVVDGRVLIRGGMLRADRVAIR